MQIIKTKIGLFNIEMSSGHIVSAKFIDYYDNFPETNNNELVSLVNAYFHSYHNISISKIKLTGTSFQKKVWRQIMKIPYGSVATYSQIAQKIGHPTAYRAVANACRQNKLALFIPCHRVVGKNNIGGYKWGINRKKWLLNFELKNKKN